MSPKHNTKKGKSLIPQSASQKENKPVYLDKNVAVMEGWATQGNTAFVLISIVFVQSAYQCFSDWSKSEMGLFWDFSRRLHQTTWQQLFDQSGKSDKTGFGYTPLPRELYPDDKFMVNLDPQTQMFELRIASKPRVHGFRYRSLFYLCYLDRNHDICP